MNEGFALYLNTNEKEELNKEMLLSKIRNLLENFGVRYSKSGNVYIPVHNNRRDHVVFTVMKLLNEISWLKKGKAYLKILNKENCCPLGYVKVDHMTEPEKKKFLYYEEYYKNTGKLAHELVIDEKRQLRDGYISYLLAVKYGLMPKVYEAFACQPQKKIVCGRHVEKMDGEWKIKSDKTYCWVYNLVDPVVPGDILEVYTRRGTAYMRVEEIKYVTGKEFCRLYAGVKQHMHERLYLN